MVVPTDQEDEMTYIICATPDCSFAAVEWGGFCEECEASIFADLADFEELEREWIEANLHQQAIEAHEAWWAEELAEQA